MKIIIRAIALIVLTVSLPANAVIVDGKDWRPFPGTGNIDWNAHDAVFDTNTGLCDVAVCLLGGTDVTDYIWASNEEVNDLIMSFGTTGLSSLTIQNEVSQGVNGLDPFFAMFDPISSGSTFEAIRGYTRESNAGRADYIGLARFIGSSDGIQDSAFLGTLEPRDRPNPQWGAWLYRPSEVPVPAAVWLFGTALIGLVGFSKRRKAA